MIKKVIKRTFQRNDRKQKEGFLLGKDWFSQDEPEQINPKKRKSQKPEPAIWNPRQSKNKLKQNSSN